MEGLGMLPNPSAETSSGFKVSGVWRGRVRVRV